MPLSQYGPRSCLEAQIMFINERQNRPISTRNRAVRWTNTAPADIDDMCAQQWRRQQKTSFQRAVNASTDPAPEWSWVPPIQTDSLTSFQKWSRWPDRPKAPNLGATKPQFGRNKAPIWTQQSRRYANQHEASSSVDTRGHATRHCGDGDGDGDGVGGSKRCGAKSLSTLVPLAIVTSTAHTHTAQSQHSHSTVTAQSQHCHCWYRWP